MAKSGLFGHQLFSALIVCLFPFLGPSFRFGDLLACHIGLQTLYLSQGLSNGIPYIGLGQILGHTPAARIHETEIGLGNCKALLGRPAVPFECFGMV